MPVRRLVGVPSRRVGPTGAASPVGSDCARTPRCLGARLLLRGFQGGDLLRQSLGTVSGVVVVRIDRRCRAHEQPCGTHPALRRAMAEERLWLPQRGGVSVCGADVDRGPNPAVAETSGAGLPVSRDRSPSVRPSRSAITGPGRGLNGYQKNTSASPQFFGNLSWSLKWQQVTKARKPTHGTYRFLPHPATEFCLALASWCAGSVIKQPCEPVPVTYAP